MKKILLLSLFVFVGMVTQFSVQAQATPSPMFLYGTVDVGGDSASPGITIFAVVDSEIHGNITLVEEGVYGDPQDPNTSELIVTGFEGETVNFMVIDAENNNIFAIETITFQAWETIEVNLTFSPFCGDFVCSEGESCSVCSQDCGSCPAPPNGGDGGGGGGGGGGAPPQQPEEEEEEPEVTEPPGEEPSPPEEPEELEQPPPETPEEPTPPTPAGFDITGFFTQNPVQSIFGAAVILIVILGLLIYWGATKQKNVTKRARGKKTQR